MHQVDSQGPLVQDVEELSFAHSEFVAGKGILQLSVMRPLPHRSCGLGLKVLSLLQLDAVLHKHIATALHVPHRVDIDGQFHVMGLVGATRVFKAFVVVR